MRVEKKEKYDLLLTQFHTHITTKEKKNRHTVCFYKFVILDIHNAHYPQKKAADQAVILEV